MQALSDNIKFDLHIYISTSWVFHLTAVYSWDWQTEMPHTCNEWGSSRGETCESGRLGKIVEGVTN